MHRCVHTTDIVVLRSGMGAVSVPIRPNRAEFSESEVPLEIYITRSARYARGALCGLKHITT